ncbi:hypothetical protein OIU78_015267 [Salix suchowensis]|uniref:Uncharacterized protein n=1 Tax=Salix koriyanagi TaxID=2511006 RepID=A0A9Q0U4U9_9ROSI|nr:hypothetical protein OIU78_015267 [Salix suchowensis]KAJ6723442.1 hypothetical protein OIU74_007920 [Salix koriyanagi]
MGLSVWLVWAEGGFHRNPAALKSLLGSARLELGMGPDRVSDGSAVGWVALATFDRGSCWMLSTGESHRRRSG